MATPYARSFKIPYWEMMKKYIAAVIFIILIFLYFLKVFEDDPPEEQSISDNNMNMVDSVKLKIHVEKICNDFFPRDYSHPENLDRLAEYIKNELKIVGGNVSEQEYVADGRTFRNVILTIGKDSEESIVVGAHYDSAGEMPGADDNASAVAGLIELAHLFKNNEPDCKIHFVAYSTEEPPYFKTNNMGSAVHADWMKKKNKKVKAMICLEMIGYFTDEPDSQDFPTILMKPFYPDTGNFILVVGKIGQGKLVKKVTRSMKKIGQLNVESLTGPESIPGVDFSDHRNYWKNGFDAVMITDSSFYRNPNYHTENDTPDTLDYKKMALVFAGVYEAIIDLSKEMK